MTSAYDPREHVERLRAETAELAALLGDGWEINGTSRTVVNHRTKIISVSLFGGVVTYRRAGDYRRSMFADVSTPADLAPWVEELAAVADVVDAVDAPVAPVATVRLISLDDPEGIAGVERQRAAEAAMFDDGPMFTDRVEFIVQLGYDASGEWEWVDSRYSPHFTEAAGMQHLEWMRANHGTDASALRLLMRLIAETVIA